MRNVQVLRFASVVAALAIMSCQLPVGDNGHDPANGTGQSKNWSFTMSLAHNNFTVAQAATDTNIVTFTRVGGFTGPINLEINSIDSGLVITSEPITTTGAVTTTRLMTHVNGPHAPFANAIYNLHAAPVSTEVEGQFLDVKFSIVRKDGTFIIAPAKLSIGKGQFVQQRISLIRTNYTAAVPMNLVFAPAGVTATFSPNPVTDTVTQMTLNVDATVPEGTYNIGVRASEGIAGFQGTAPIALTVTAPGSFTISAPTNPLAVPKNATVPTSIAIARTNFPGPITFAVTGAPPGVNVIFTNPATGPSFLISFGNTGTAVAGAYVVTITASGAGAPPQSIQLTINVS